MITFDNPGHRLVESLGELPTDALRRCRRIYLDFETTSHDDRLDSLNPWYSCWAAGLAITGDDLPGAWYVAMDHRDRRHCLPTENVADWLDSVMTPEKTWVNHHVKYDAHVSANCLGVKHEGPLRCTLVQAKLHDTDRMTRGGYGLDVLSRDLLGEEITQHYDEIRRWLFLRMRGKRAEYSRDYGRIPALAMAPYACQDVITDRRLDRWQTSLLPESMAEVSAVEEELTTVLFEMERHGLRVDPMMLRAVEIITIEEMMRLDEELAAIVGRSFNPMSSDQLYDVLVNQYGLPVMGWTEGDEDDENRGNPSFDKEAMARYLNYPYSPPGLVERIARYRKLGTFRSLFLEQYIVLSGGTSSGRLHGTYNQMVRTGRLSGSEPNPQQLNAEAKELILPDPGCAFLAQDQSQIEFRIIAHFVQNAKVIAAYRADPDTDFHDWMATVSGMSRGPAKTMNFRMGYGGGKKNTVKALSVDKEIVGALTTQVESMILDGRLDRSAREAMFSQLATERAEWLYGKYHATLPELKPTARLAGNVCRDRGYVYDPSGRRRHLPPAHSHKAFNTLCQGYAAGIQKKTTVMMARAQRGTPLKMSANVHDETVTHGPAELLEDRRVLVATSWILEHPGYALDVPLRAASGISREHWRGASKGPPKPRPVKYTEEELRWLSSTPQEDLLAFLRS